ncbi:MAG: DNA primase [Bdellovibrionota bacterium]
MGIRFTPELLKKIRDSVNLIDVVGAHVVLRKAGSNHVGLCPFHSERTPSFSVSETKQLYYCHGCGCGGDLFRFVMDAHGTSFSEAVMELAEMAGIKLSQERGASGGDTGQQTQDIKNIEIREKSVIAYKLNRFVATYYNQLLYKNSVMKDYVRKRGCSDDIIRSFYMGAATGAWDGLVSYLGAKKAPVKLAIELGLIRSSQKGMFDLFRNRVIFPIINTRGKIVGFGGRSVPPALAGETPSGGGDPKYMNSTESWLFHKSKVVFGLFQAQKYIRERDEAVVVEGYFDVIAMHAAGFQNVVSTCGTAITREHLLLLRRFANKVVLLFDGDKAGLAATQRAMELGLEEGVVLYGASVPSGMDPDEVLFDQQSGELLSGGKQQMTEILEHSKPILDERIEEAINRAGNGTEERASAIKQIGNWLGKLKDPVGSEVRVQFVRDKLGVSAPLMAEAIQIFAKQQNRPGKTQKPVKTTSDPVVSRLEKWEYVLLRGVVLGGEYWDILRKFSVNLPPNLTPGDLFYYPPAAKFVRTLLIDFSKRCHEDVLHTIFAECVDQQIGAIIAKASLEPKEKMFSDVMIVEFKTALETGQARAWVRFSHQIKADITKAEANKDAQLEVSLKKEYLDVQRKIKEFNSSYDKNQGA